MLLLRALGSSAFQCATRPGGDTWHASVSRAPAVVMDLVPEPAVDEAMKAMQEVNELRAQLEASTAKLKKFTLPAEPTADVPPPPAAVKRKRRNPRPKPVAVDIEVILTVSRTHTAPVFCMDNH